MKENYDQYAVAGKVLHYNQENLIKVARTIKPEGELTEEDLNNARQHFLVYKKETAEER
jgi:hypothetical protein